MWRCKECGEKSEKIFLNCWNCNLPRNTSCDVSPLIQWCDSDFDRNGNSVNPFDAARRSRVLIKTAAEPVYRLAKLFGRFAIALKIISLGFLISGFAIAVIFCPTRIIEFVGCALVLVVASIMAFVSVRLSTQSFILKMTIHLLLHVAPDLRNECETIHAGSGKI